MAICGNHPNLHCIIPTSSLLHRNAASEAADNFEKWLTTISGGGGGELPRRAKQIRQQAEKVLRIIKENTEKETGAWELHFIPKKLSQLDEWYVPAKIIILDLYSLNK